MVALRFAWLSAWCGEYMIVYRYELEVFTADCTYAGTDADVFVVLSGSMRQTTERQLFRSSEHSDKFERGSTDRFILETTNIGTLHTATLRLDARTAMQKMNARW